MGISNVPKIGIITISVCIAVKDTQVGILLRTRQRLGVKVSAEVGNREKESQSQIQL